VDIFSFSFLIVERKLNVVGGEEERGGRPVTIIPSRQDSGFARKVYREGNVYLFHTIAWRIASVSTASPLTILLLLGLKNDSISLDHNSM
jgi:hypothetical protein